MSTRGTPHIIRGDSFAVLPTLGSNMCSAIVTDPPYGIGFMGEKWDVKTPLEYQQWSEAWGRLALEILCPGGTLVAFSSPRTYHRLVVGLEDAGFEIRDCLMWLYGQGFPKHRRQLKPAWEPIVLATKPLDGSLSKNLDTWGTGLFNIDECRIACGAPRARFVADQGRAVATSNGFGGDNKLFHVGETTEGRWPANVLLDPVAARRLDQDAGWRHGSGGGTVVRRAGNRNTYNPMAGGDVAQGYDDEGNVSRFFYCSKDKIREHGNDHPTVKPLDLMRWLVRLVTSPGELVVDPFAGSGTTLVAAVSEGVDALGIEAEVKYIGIAKRRLAALDRPETAAPKAKGRMDPRVPSKGRARGRQAEV